MRRRIVQVSAHWTSSAATSIKLGFGYRWSYLGTFGIHRIMTYHTGGER